MITVFLSSTSRELADCRAAVYAAIEGLEGYHCVRMEDFGAWNATPEDLCRRRVASCDLFVLLAGPVFGSATPSGASYTQAEYEAADGANRPLLVFLTADDFLIPASVAESAAARRKQDAFRKKVSVRTCATFDSSADVATKVVQAIRNWEASPAEHSIVRVQRVGTEDAREFRRPFLRFGRNPDVEVPVVDDPEVSWEHGMAFKHAGQLFYRHLSATNNSWLTRDGRTMTLNPGDSQDVQLSASTQLTIGRTTLLVQFAPGDERRTIVRTDKQYG